MNYGYIRVSGDKQTVKNQRLKLPSIANIITFRLVSGLKKLSPRPRLLKNQFNDASL